MDYKQEAEKIVEMFMPYTGTGDAYNFRATQCAIKHVEGILDALRKIEGGNIIYVENEYISILNQLKQM